MKDVTQLEQQVKVLLVDQINENIELKRQLDIYKAKLDALDSSMPVDPPASIENGMAEITDVTHESSSIYPPLNHDAQELKCSWFEGEKTEVLVAVPPKVLKAKKVKKVAKIYFRSRIDWFRAKSLSSNPGGTARKRMKRIQREKDIYEFHQKIRIVNKSVIMMGKWMDQEKDRLFNGII